MSAPLIDSPEQLREIASAFQKSRIVLSAVELGIFTHVGEGGRSSADIAAAIGGDDRATDRLMNALCALGLLTKDNGLFFNTPFGTRALIRDTPGYQGGLMHSAHLWGLWSGLTERVAPGFVTDKDWTRPFIAAMHDRAWKQAPEHIAGLPIDGVRRVLDVGGGSGAYAMAFVRAIDGATATVFDLPRVTELARQYVASEGLSDRVDTRSGDYTTDELGEGYDLVFLSAIVHSNAPAVNERLIASCVRALNPGGRVVVMDYIMNDDRTGPVRGAVFALNMLVATSAGDTYTASEIGGWMRAAGCTRVEQRETGFDVAQIIGTKGA